MVAWHIEQWHVQYGDEIFQIFIRHIATAEDEFHILKMAVG
jgi:hypothetical protein